MANILISYRDQVAGGGLSGGSWRSDAPLSNLQNNKPWRRARSSSDAAADSIVDVTFPEITGIRSLRMDFTNLSTAFKYRVRAWTMASRVDGDELYDSDWVEGGSRAVFGSIPFGGPHLYDGYTAVDDPERGVPLIHIFSGIVSSRFWRVEIDDHGNPSGYVEAGRLFMGRSIVPSINYGYGQNGIEFINNTLVANMLDGSKQRRRRFNPRQVSFAFDYLPETELYADFYDFIRYSGFDREVAIFLDPESTGLQLQRTSFLGAIAQASPMAQVAFQLGSTAYTVEELF